MKNECITKNTLVRLKKSAATKFPRGTAYVERRLRDIKGGVRLDHPLEQFIFWNIEELEIVPKRKVRKT